MSLNVFSPSFYLHQKSNFPRFRTPINTNDIEYRKKIQASNCFYHLKLTYYTIVRVQYAKLETAAKKQTFANSVEKVFNLRSPARLKLHVFFWISSTFYNVPCFMFSVFSSSPEFSVCIIYYYIFVFFLVQTLSKWKKKFFRIWGLNWVQLENTFFLTINFRLSGFENFPLPLSFLVFALWIVK